MGDHTSTVRSAYNDTPVCDKEALQLNTRGKNRLSCVVVILNSAMAIMAGVVLFAISVAPPHPLGWTKPLALFFGLAGVVTCCAGVLKCLRDPE